MSDTIQINKQRISNQESLSNLLAVNTNKMNFQQTMCFHMHNWAIVFTGVIIGFSWNTTIEDMNVVIPIIFHFLLLMILGYFWRERYNWMIYFLIFRERVRLLEDLIVNETSKEIDQFDKKYYLLQNSEERKFNMVEIYKCLKLKRTQKNEFKQEVLLKLKFCWIYLLLIIVTLVSGVLKYNEYCKLF